MNPSDNLSYFEELDDLDQTGKLDLKGRHSRRIQWMPEKVSSEEREMLNDQSDSREHFKFTYKAARFEEWWLLDSLGDFYEHRWIADVMRRVKGGKEASVYQCRAGAAVDTDLVAAKVYRPRSLRNLKNDGAYRAGRHDLDDEGKRIVEDGKLHAIAKRSEYGRNLQHQSWIAYEFTTLQTLHAAGGDVPEPYTLAANAILMGYIGDQDGSAPALNEVSLDPGEARSLFRRVLDNIDLMLGHDRIHGDLSAYNILYWEGQIALIDFPQVVAPGTNPDAYRIFERDVVRVCEYFAKQGIREDAHRLASRLWTSHGHRLIAEVHPRDLDADKAEDRRLWHKQHDSR